MTVAHMMIKSDGSRYLNSSDIIHVLSSLFSGLKHCFVFFVSFTLCFSYPLCHAFVTLRVVL